MANDILTRSDLLTDHQVDPGRDSFFNGYVSQGENSKDPYVSGFAFIKWIKVPDWIDPEKGRLFRQLTERNFKALSGLNDMQMDTGSITAGFTNNESSFAKGGVQKAEGFNLRYQEQSGSPITKTYNGWVSGIRDPKTGIATYPKRFNKAYHSSNHTGILLYVVTRPDADNFGAGPDKSNIEFAALWTNVMPTKIMLNHFNFQSGDHDNAESEQEFKGMLHIGEAVERFAAQNMSSSSIYKFYNENDFLNLNEFAPSIPSA